MSKRIVAITLTWVLLFGGTVAATATSVTALDAGSNASAGGEPAAGTSPAASDHPLQSGEAYWRGFRLRFDGNRIVADPGSATEEERQFEIWGVNEDGRLESRVSTFTINESGVAEIRTGSLTGRYVIRHGGEPVYVQDGVGYHSSPPDGTTVTVESGSFRIRRQTLSASWTDRTVYNGQITRLALESNRSDYVVAVSATGVTFENLTDAFRPRAYATNFDERKDEDVILLSATSRSEYVVNITGFDPGTTSFDMKAADARAATAATLEVSQPPGSLRIENVERRDQVGEILHLTVQCGHCYLMVGGRNQGAFDIVELTDGNGDDRVTLRVNTRYAGIDLTRESVPDEVTPYMAGGDSARRLQADEHVDPPDVNAEYALGEVREDFGVPAHGRKAPLSPGIYDLTIADSKYMDVTIRSRNDYRDRQFSVRDERHVQSVVLTEAGLQGTETRLAPGGIAAKLNPETIHSQTTGSDTVAFGDQLVVSVDVSGIYGYLLAEHGNRIQGIVDNDEEGISLRIGESDDAAPVPTKVDLLRSDARLIADPAGDRLFVVIDTSTIKGNRPVEAGQTHRVRFALSGDTYPYVPAGRTQAVDSEITFVNPEANVTTRFEEEERIAFSGTTTVAPGSVLTVRASVKGPYSWERATGVAVGPDRTWRTSMDFRDAPADEVEVRVSYQGEVLAGIDSLVVEPPATETPETTTREAPETVTGSPDGSPGPVTTSPSTAAGESNGTGAPSSPGTTAASSEQRGGEPGGGSGIPFAPAIPAVSGILGLLVPVVAVVSLLGIVTLQVVG